ncbi:unnamed protein product, partial [marine sediment metagenome]
DLDKQRQFFESLGMPELGFCLPPEHYRFLIADLLGEITPGVFPLTNKALMTLAVYALAREWR